MVYGIALVAAALLGLGWVLQQWAAVQAPHELGRPSRLLALVRHRGWSAGIAALSAGQTSASVALQAGPITLVDPLLSTNILFAYAAWVKIGRRRPSRRGVGVLSRSWAPWPFF